MSAEFARLLVLVAVASFPDDGRNPQALRYLEQAQQVLKDAGQEGDRSDWPLHEIGLAYAGARADAEVWKTIAKIWRTPISTSALARLSVVFARRDDMPQAEEALRQALATAALENPPLSKLGWQEIAIAQVWLNDLDQAVATVKRHDLHRALGRDIYLRRLLDAYCARHDPRGALAFMERVLDQSFQKADLHLVSVVAEVAMKKGAIEVAAEISWKAAALLGEKNVATDCLDVIFAARCCQVSGLADEAPRLAQEAARLAKEIKQNGDRTDSAKMLAELYAALGDKDLAVAQSELVRNKRGKQDILARVPVGLAHAGRFEDAVALFLQLDSDFGMLSYEGTLAIWEIAELASEMGKPRVATQALLKLTAPPKPPVKGSETDQASVVIALPRWFAIDSEGDLQRVIDRGLRTVCKSLAKNGSPEDAIAFMTAMGRSTYLSPNSKAMTLVSIAEGIIAAETAKKQPQP